MEEVLKQAALTCPSLVVLVVIVYVFLKVGATIATNFQKFIEQRDTTYMEFMRTLNNSHLDARLRQEKAIDLNTLATKELTNAFREFLNSKMHRS